jgi:hypothetical protein
MSNVNYQGHDRRRGNQILEGRIEDLEADVLSLKGNVDGLRGKVDAVERAIVANTTLTADVKSDTEELVTILKGSKVFARLVSWGAAIAASAVTVYWTVRGK